MNYPSVRSPVTGEWVAPRRSHLALRLISLPSRPLAPATLWPRAPTPAPIVSVNHWRIIQPASNCRSIWCPLWRSWCYYFERMEEVCAGNLMLNPSQTRALPGGWEFMSSCVQAGYTTRNVIRAHDTVDGRCRQRGTLLDKRCRKLSYRALDSLLARWVRALCMYEKCKILEIGVRKEVVVQQNNCL